MKLLTGLAMLKTRSEILYKTKEDLGGAFGDLPTLEQGLSKLKKHFAQAPPEVAEPMKDLYKHCNGVAGIEVDGLPGGWEIVVAFENFHPSKVLASLLKEAEQDRSEEQLQIKLGCRACSLRDLGPRLSPP